MAAAGSRSATHIAHAVTAPHILHRNPSAARSRFVGAPSSASPAVSHAAMEPSSTSTMPGNSQQQQQQPYSIDVADEDEHAPMGKGTVWDADSLPHAAGGSGRPGESALNLGVEGLPQPVTGVAGARARWDTPVRQEILKGVANRFVHSTAYIYFYAAMAVASVLTVGLSLLQECPGALFYGLELGINVVLISEVSIRAYAFGKQFWKSTFNIIDLCVVLLCALTLLVLFFSHDCSPYRHHSPMGGDGSDAVSGGGRGGRGEELLDSLVLIVRNGLQLFRLLAVVRRSGSNVASRVPNIDLNAAATSGLGGAALGGAGGGGGVGAGGFAGAGVGAAGMGLTGGRGGATASSAALQFDIDDLVLEYDDSALARQRMAFGGDPDAARRHQQQQQQQQHKWQLQQQRAGLAGGGAPTADPSRFGYDDDDDDDEEL